MNRYLPWYGGPDWPTRAEISNIWLGLTMAAVLIGLYEALAWRWSLPTISHAAHRSQVVFALVLAAPLLGDVLLLLHFQGYQGP